jgi:membrane fusion protein (multidrug efflux system)
MAYTSLMRLDRQDAALTMRNAELAAADAQEQYRRAESMAQRGLISQEELDAKRTQKKTADVTLEQGRVRLQYKTIDDARFRYDRAKTELEEAELRLQYTTVKAPIAGVVSQRHVVRGQYVNTQQHLFTIVDTTRLLARPFLPEKFSGRLQAGQAVYVEVEALPEQRFPARVKLISPVVDAASGTFKVTVELDKPPPQLKPGMFATVYITVEQRDKALVIPKRALTLDNLRPTVYRVQRGRASQVVLTVGVTDNAVVEVLSGLAEGDQVVVVGQDMLLDNAMVQVVPE